MKNLLIQAFDEPNHTQTPNKFFDMIPDMSEAELRVTLVMIRHTLGYHKNTFKMGMQKLGDASGLTRQGAMAGAEAAEQRGIFKRSNPDSQKEAEWELNLLPVNVDDMSTSFTPSVNVDDTKCNPRLQQSPIKESIKEKKQTKLSEKDLEQVNKKFYAIINNGQIADNFKVACESFEMALLGNIVGWPWDTTSKWQKFAKWVAAQDPAQFKQYADWRKGDGKFHAMSNNKIRQDPQMFIDTGWPTFLAHVSMYKPKDKGFAL